MNEFLDMPNFDSISEILSPIAWKAEIFERKNVKKTELSSSIYLAFLVSDKTKSWL